MIQYLDLLKTIQEKGTYKPAAREGMPGTQSLFGHQFRHDLSEGFPLLTTKKMYWKGVIVELLWFLRGDTNIKYLIDNNVNIWNEDAYQYYLKQHNKIIPERNAFDFNEFISSIKNNELIPASEKLRASGYKYGDCGYQYGKVWRELKDYEVGYSEFVEDEPIITDQIVNLINSLQNTPESRRHLVTALIPTKDKDLALYWCHALFQFNCRPLTHEDKIKWVIKNTNVEMENLYIYDETLKESTPKYYLDCQLYQRSADSILGVPFNIASYALLTHILCELCNMIPGEFIHSFGDVHIYDNHKEAATEQLIRIPSKLPNLRINTEFWNPENILNIEKGKITSNKLTTLVMGFNIDDFQIENYNPQSKIQAELSTGLKK